MKEFSFSTISDFDNHISSSIKGYELLDDIILNISSFFAKNGERVIDIGCTSGRLLQKMSNKYDCKFIGYDIEDKSFLESTEEVTLLKLDITDKSVALPLSNLVLSVFTLQFIRVSDRASVIKKVYDSLNKGGAFIVCEKEHASNGVIQDVFTFSNYDHKKNKFSPEEILNKEESLRRIMNPMQSGGNKKMLEEVGFTVEQFFQSMNFKGWLCIK